MRVILRKGHIGVNFYFIYSGSVFINVEEASSTGAKVVASPVTPPWRTPTIRP